MPQTIKAKVMRDVDWGLGVTLRLMIGSENAAGLASSTPAGGTQVAEIPAWPELAMLGGLGADGVGEPPLGDSLLPFGLGEGELGYGALGVNDAARAVLEHRYQPADPCSTLPVGVVAVDVYGNESLVQETTVTLTEPPAGIRGLAIAAADGLGMGLLGTDPLGSDSTLTGAVKLTWTASPHIEGAAA